MRLHRKVVDLHPFSEWKLDVFIGGSDSQLNDIFKYRYGVDYDGTENCVYTIDSDMQSELKGHTRIVMRVQSFDTSIMVHELLHVLWHASKCIGFEMNYGTQEWQACMFEYLFDQCRDKKTYTEIK
jgi:hypothetical protein